MEIKKLTADQLQNFIDSDEYNRLDNIPISRSRALSHINNPRLETEDIIMFLAYDNKKFAGYLGAVPDYIFIDDKPQKVAWLSCMWVDKTMRGQGIAPKLLDEANKTWNSNLLIVNFTSTAKNSYDKINAFTELKTYSGERFYRRLNLATLLSAKNKKYKKYYGLLRFGDFCFNIFNDLRNLILSKQFDNNISLEYVNFIDKQTKDFIDNLNKNNLSKRGKPELDWIMLYPWILTSPTKNNEDKRYEFSVSDKQFLTLNIKIFYKNKLTGFLMLNVRNKHLRIPYFFSEPENVNIISQVIAELTKKLKTDYITVFNNELINELKNTLQYFHRKTQYRTFLISEKLLKNYPRVKDLDLQDGEGDSAFT